jgi:DNA replication protein DnaC
MGIDDYGVEYVEPFALSQFELLVERRYARHLITIVTTNIPKASFKTRKGFERIESRLLKRCNWVEFIGEDRRKVLNGKETV